MPAARQGRSGRCRCGTRAGMPVTLLEDGRTPARRWATCVRTRPRRVAAGLHRRQVAHTIRVSDAWMGASRGLFGADKGLFRASNELVRADNGLSGASNELIRAGKGLIRASNELIRAGKGWIRADKGLFGASNELIRADKGLFGASDGLIRADKELFGAPNELIRARKGLIGASKGRIRAGIGPIAAMHAMHRRFKAVVDGRSIVSHGEIPRFAMCLVPQRVGQCRTRPSHQVRRRGTDSPFLRTSLTSGNSIVFPAPDPVSSTGQALTLGRDRRTVVTISAPRK